MNKINTRAMVEGSILAALTAIMGIFYNIPFVSIITMFWPVPIIIVGYRNGFRVSIIAAFVAALLASLIITPVVGAILFITYAVPGAVMGYMMRKEVSPYATILVCGLLLSITAVAEFILGLELVLNINIIQILTNLKGAMSSYYNEIYNQFNNAVETYRKLGIDENTIQQAVANFDTVLRQIIVKLPSSILGAGVLVSFLNFKVVKLILSRTGYKIKDIHRFSEWTLSSRTKYIVLGLTFILLLMMSVKIYLPYGIIDNIWQVLLWIYAILGLSVVAHMVNRLGEKYDIPKGVRRLILFFSILMLPVLPYIGMFDIAADIRRFDRNTPGGAR